jgi:hypothetical protein
MKIRTVVEVPEEEIASLIISAFEGGSNYWYEIKDFVEPSVVTYRTDAEQIYKHVDYPMSPEGALVITSLEEPERKPARLNLRTIQSGLVLLSQSKEYAHHWRDIVKGDCDQITGDVFLQFCLYGEVLYG